MSLRARLLSQVYRLLIPRVGRRILFIISLYCNVMGIEQVKAEVIHQLNHVLHLSDSDDTLELPVVARKWLWRKVPLSDILPDNFPNVDLSVDELARIAKAVEDATPVIMRYGTPGEMANDVVRLFEESKHLHPKAA